MPFWQSFISLHGVPLQNVSSFPSKRKHRLSDGQLCLDEDACGLSGQLRLPEPVGIFCHKSVIQDPDQNRKHCPHCECRGNLASVFAGDTKASCVSLCAAVSNSTRWQNSPEPSDVTIMVYSSWQYRYGQNIPLCEMSSTHLGSNAAMAGDAAIELLQNQTRMPAFVFVSQTRKKESKDWSNFF